MINSDIKVLFLSENIKLGASIIRAKTVSKQLEKMGIKTSSISYKKFKLFQNYYIKKYDIFIFIKRIDLKLAENIKNKSKIVVVDTVDNYEFSNGSLWSKDNIYTDYYIVNTKEHQLFLKEKFNINNKKSYIIEHHHSNIKNYKKNIKNYKTFGFIGAIEQFSKSDKLINFLTSKGLELYVPQKSPTSNEEAVNETLKLDCFILNLDCNISNHKENVYEYMIKFKPAQKILLPFSLGIPTVLAPYESYKEAIEQANYDVDEFLMASNEDELIEKLNEFLHFSELQRNELIAKQQRVASLFTIEKVSDKYMQMFENIYEHDL